MKKEFFRRLRKLEPRGMQTTVMLTFSAISMSIILILSGVMYLRVSALSREESIQSTQKLMAQTGENLEDYLVRMRRISDAVYYNVIKESDFSGQDQEIQRGMNILYEANKDDLRNVAVYNHYGSLITAEPVASQKEDPNVTRQEWYERAMEETENLHFSTPHVQNLFDDGSQRYYWVISLSRAVELTVNGDSQMGVLLVDMDYSNISRMMEQMNELGTGQYFYLCDSSGELVYHQKQAQISRGIFQESSEKAARHGHGVYEEDFGGEKRKILVKNISYTGWKLVGVLPYSSFTMGMLNVRYFVVMMMLLMAMMLVVINYVMSVRISRPILRLSQSVREYEAGKKPRIYVGGSLEIRHLGQAIQDSYEEIERLMKQIVLEENERRKSELDALQSQINPHFLYNTLESITWMVEGERNEEASFMIFQLAKLFRISLSKGRTVIRIKDELQHAQSYMNIQKIRYKNQFSVIFDVDPEMESFCTVKLILQPILENAIHYGVGNMDEEEGGQIRIVGRRKEGDLLLEVEDNGMGMSREEVSHLLDDDGSRVPKRGSGVGLVNVNRRIQLFFGQEYGITVESEPDEGTTVRIRMPAVPYTEDNRKILEKGYLFSKEELLKKDSMGRQE